MPGRPGTAQRIPKPPGPQQGHPLSSGAGVFRAGRPEARAGGWPLQREGTQRGCDPRLEAQDGPENTQQTLAGQPRRPCPGAATGREGDRILNRSPREDDSRAQRPQSPTLATRLLLDVTPTS